MQHRLLRSELQAEEMVEVVALLRGVRRWLLGAMAPGEDSDPWQRQVPQAELEDPVWHQKVQHARMQR
jgi:hypothetical protein